MERWSKDLFRCPPYQYQIKQLLINQKGELRLPSIEEKEYLMGFPIQHTSNCMVKAKGAREHLLLSLLDPGPSCSPQAIMDMLNPKHQIFLQSRLWRQPALRGQPQDQDCHLVSKLGQLIRVLCKFHRLHPSLPKIISGWCWGRPPERVNSLEM